MKLVLYARVSTDDTGQTTETQRVAMENFCKTYGHEIVEYISEEMSASSLDRPGLLKAMSYCMFSRADGLLAYDPSRITRNNDINFVVNKISPGKLLFVTSGEYNPDNSNQEMIQSIIGAVDKNENKVRREKSRMGIATRKREGFYHGRPAVFMFEEDLKGALKGRYMGEHTKKDGTVVPATKVITESQFYGWAKEGYSLTYVARVFLNVPTSVLIAEIKLKESEPKMRVRKYARSIPVEQRTEKDYIPVYKFKGVKDRYTPYMTFYEQKMNERKTSSSENPVNEG